MQDANALTNIVPKDFREREYAGTPMNKGLASIVEITNDVSMVI